MAVPLTVNDTTNSAAGAGDTATATVTLRLPEASEAV